MKLTPQQIGFIQLIQRSPADADGWRRVSKAVMPLVRKFDAPELIDFEESEDGSGRCRFSERGRVLADYV